MILIGNDDFGKNLAIAVKCDFAEFEQRIFPDGEVCPRILCDLAGKDVIIANHLSLPIEPNRYFIETLLLVRNCNEMNAKSVKVVIPYFIYARQDKMFRSGEPYSAKFILESLEKAGASEFYTISSHTQREKEMLELSKSPVHNLNGFVSIESYLKSKQLKNPIIIGPDKGAEIFAKTVSKALGCDYSLLEKHRDLDTGHIEIKCNINLQGKDVIIIDDIISSGDTMIKAIDLIAKNKPSSISCYVIHLVSNRAIKELENITDEFLSTDTIETSVSKISVVSQLADKIKS